eukprot:TRINITY_DN2608_c0_g3_i4.p1 TRINITY_DN2608_c0_g3~~TRINITY_DN2608_c0_g3_i4.p1  ORF type:complete len:606 (+),score=139.71 TRINITY_DN2608_c0_g3_i4:808-2625(+)
MFIFPKNAQIYVQIGDIHSDANFENKDVKLAIKHYLVALSMDSKKYGYLQFVVGRLFVEINETASAMPHLLKALGYEEGVNLLSCLLLLGNLNINSPQIAKDYFKDVLKLDPQNVSAFQGLVMVGVVEKNFEDVFKYTKIVAQMDPSKREHLCLASSVLVQSLFDGLKPKARDEETLQSLEKLEDLMEIQEGQESPSLHYIAGMVTYWKGDYHKALFHFEKVCVLSPSFESGINKQLSKNKQDQETLQLDEGSRGVGDSPKLAKKKKKKKLPSSEKSGNVSQHVVKTPTTILEGKGNDAEVPSELDNKEPEGSVMERLNHVRDVLFLSGMVKKQAREYSLASLCFQQGLYVKPDDLECLLELGIVDSYLNKHQEAISTLRRALVLYPQDPRIPFVLGNVLAQLEKYEQSLVQYLKALSLINKDTGDPEFLLKLYNNLGVAYHRLGGVDKHSEYMDRIDEIVEKHPYLADKIHNQELVYLLEGKELELELERKGQTEMEENQQNEKKEVPVDAEQCEKPKSFASSSTSNLLFYEKVQEILKDPALFETGRIDDILRNAFDKDVQEGRIRDMTDQEITMALAHIDQEELSNLEQVLDNIVENRDVHE